MNWFAYRLPGKNRIETGCSDSLKEGLGTPGFAIAPFDGNADGIFTIPYDSQDGLFTIPSDCEKDTLYPFPETETDKNLHNSAVRQIKKQINDGVLDKCVLARVIVRKEQIALHSTFQELCTAYPEAFVFCFHTTPSGTWIGASPEILLEKSGNRLTTMALAGTRPTYSSEEWDDKNIGEQKIVTSFLSAKMKEAGLEPIIGKTRTHNAGPVEHLRTIISAEVDTTDEKAGLLQAIKTARALSPTPALAGYPRKRAMQFIGDIEDFERGYYGGFCGPVAENGDFFFGVNLRSARVERDRFCIYAGGGIMKESDPDSEWTETERKASTCLDKFHYITI